MKGCILIVITLSLLGCSNDDLTPVDSAVHLAGFLGTSSGSSVASYWKDGVYTGLTHDTIYSNVHSLFVDGSSVLIGGWIINPPSKSVIWQGGTETIIKGAHASITLIASHNNKLFGVWYDDLTGLVFSNNGNTQPVLDTAFNIAASGLALLGDDMYISGQSVYSDGKPDSKSYQHAQCWKNGQLIFRESENSNAWSIFIYQNDIYMAGHVYDPGPPFTNSIACYWKNGQRYNLPGVDALTTSVFVTDTHVYASGTIDQQAVYWKDGEAIALTTEGTFSMANSIFVQGTDVHVGGYEHGHPAYWKNDVKQTIVNQDRFGQIKFVVAGSN